MGRLVNGSSSGNGWGNTIAASIVVLLLCALMTALILTYNPRAGKTPEEWEQMRYSCIPLEAAEGKTITKIEKTGYYVFITFDDGSNIMIHAYRGMVINNY